MKKIRKTTEGALDCPLYPSFESGNLNTDERHLLKILFQ